MEGDEELDIFTFKSNRSSGQTNIFEQWEETTGS